MRQFIIYLFALLLIVSQSAKAQDSSPDTNTSPAARINDFKANISDKKIVLQWKVSSNETVSQFEIERSYDGKNFVTAALVFGTDKNDIENYQFYEKANNNRKTAYRIRITGKDKRTGYSDILRVE